MISLYFRLEFWSVWAMFMPTFCVVGALSQSAEEEVVFSVDEKSGIQALDRTRPVLPLRPGVPERQTHDYIRHGTICLYATLRVLDSFPTSNSWLNLVERWFGEITRDRIRRGTFESVPALVAAIEDYLQQYNDAPRRFVWTTSADMILDKSRSLLNRQPHQTSSESRESLELT